MKQVGVALLAAFLFFISAKIVFAAAPVILSYPQEQLHLDIPFSISATMSGLSSNAVYRLRIALSKPGTTSYFGSTFNGSNWYNGLPSPITYANFFSITTDGGGVWAGDMQGKIELTDTNFSGESGPYDLKIGRYTQNGSTATWSNIVSVNIIAPTFTPTPVMQKSPTVSHSSPAPTQTPVPTVPQLVTSSVQKNSFITQQLYPTAHFSKEIVLSASVSATSTPSAKPSSMQKVKGVAENRFPILFVVGGIMLVISGASMVFFVRKKIKKESM